MKNTNLYKLLLTLSFFTSACFSDLSLSVDIDNWSHLPLRFAIDNKFTDYEVSLIESAAYEWEIATDSKTAVVLFPYEFYSNQFTVDEWERDEDMGLLFKISSTDPGYIDLVKKLNKTFAGIVNMNTLNIALLINGLNDHSTLREVMMHELGHLYGLRHSRNGIMREKVSNSRHNISEDDHYRHDCIHKYDLNEFCKIHYCGSRVRSTCEYQ